jgi:aspartate kinase
MIVMKFGGTSVGSAKEISIVADLVGKEVKRKKKVVVVVSAMSKVTDKLDAIAKKIITIKSGEVESEVDKFHDELLLKHLAAAKDAIPDKKIQADVSKELTELCGKLRYALVGIGYLEDLSPKSLDYIHTFGERLSVLIVSGALNSRGIKSKHLSGHEAGIVTNSNFGQARPLFRRLEKTIPEKINPLLNKGFTLVVTGYIAADEEGRLTTLGRGGSDYSAALIGRYMKAEEVQIWTDVNGILTTDPRIVPQAKLISTMSYSESMDLAYYGAKVIHAKMIEPAMDADIPVRILNTFNPSHPGTLIVKEQKKAEGVVKALSIMKDVAVINLKGVGLSETPNIAATVFNILGENNINIVMISAASDANLSFVVKRSDMQQAVGLMNCELMNGTIRNLEIIDDACIIAVVGAGMRGEKGIAAKIFQTVADEDVNIVMIAQGSSEVNISFLVKEKDGDKALKALHKRFIE